MTIFSMTAKGTASTMPMGPQQRLQKESDKRITIGLTLIALPVMFGSIKSADRVRKTSRMAASPIGCQPRSSCRNP